MAGPLGTLFIDGGHTDEAAEADDATGRPASRWAGRWPSTKCSGTRPTAARCRPDPPARAGVSRVPRCPCTAARVVERTAVARPRAGRQWARSSAWASRSAGGVRGRRGTGRRLRRYATARRRRGSSPPRSSRCARSGSASGWRTATRSSRRRRIPQELDLGEHLPGAGPVPERVQGQDKLAGLRAGNPGLVAHAPDAEAGHHEIGPARGQPVQRQPPRAPGRPAPGSTSPSRTGTCRRTPPGWRATTCASRPAASSQSGCGSPT